MDDIVWRPSFTENNILAALPSEEMRRIRSALTAVRLVPGQVLCESGEQISSVFFLAQGIASIIPPADNIFASADVALCGREGIVGCTSMLGSHVVSFNRIVMQTSGLGYRMSADMLRVYVTQLPRFRTFVALNIELVFAQVSQSAACNAQHSLSQRLARWLLLARDRSDGDELAFTHEFLASIISVRRAGVTVALRSLADDGLIGHGRGKIVIKNRHGLEHAACSCYARVRDFVASRSAIRSAA